MEHRVGTSTTRTRLLALLAVIVLHVLFSYAIQGMRALPRASRGGVDAALVMVRIEPPRVPERVPESARMEVPIAPEQRESQRGGGSIEAEQAAFVASSPPRAIDWRANARRSAQLAVEGGLQEGHRSFGPREKPQPQEAAVPSVFGSGPKHKLGDLDPDAAGDPVVWLNERCYMTLDKQVQTARDWIKEAPGRFAPVGTVCLFSIGRREPDGTLFEHIRKREEPPVPKAGTEMNALPERADEP